MSERLRKSLKQILHPYMFVLKEGAEFQQDYLDYSLMILHINCLEVFKSPSPESSEILSSLTVQRAKSAPAQPPLEQADLATPPPPA